MRWLVHFRLEVLRKALLVDFRVAKSECIYGFACIFEDEKAIVQF